MMRLALISLGLLLLVGQAAPAGAESRKAAALRQKQGLIVFTPPEKFLASNFVTSEMAPRFIFGTIKAFAASRQFPTTWLIEADEKNRYTSGDQPGQREYFVYLEEDRPDKVVHYVFADQSGVPPLQWIDFRRFFYKRATEAQYAPVKAKLEQARQEGFGAAAELSFILEDGVVMQKKSPQEALRQELKFAPLYDLGRQRKVSD
ncbi:MAG: hypothetical protein ACYDIC_00385 [Desulfobaccales bacterium]